MGEENSELRHSVVLPREKMAAELEENNRLLSQKLEDLQKEVLAAGQCLMERFVYALAHIFVSMLRVDPSLVFCCFFCIY